MANNAFIFSFKAFVMVMLLIMSLSSSMVFLRCEGRILRNNEDDDLFQKKIGLDLSKLKRFHHQVKVGEVRISPGGPDPQHHV
ncbi:CLAVATA3/ESR-RELATED 5 [Euphorbia peplus]|nr:CLAVATA3/ESR-RELATED 5 [Euphorbia peplus]